MTFTAPWGHRVRYTGARVVLSSTPPEQRIESQAVGNVIGPGRLQGFVKVQFDDVDGPVDVRESSLQESSDDDQ